MTLMDALRRTHSGSDAGIVAARYLNAVSEWKIIYLRVLQLGVRFDKDPASMDLSPDNLAHVQLKMQGCKDQVGVLREGV